MSYKSVVKKNNVNIIGRGEQVMLFAHGFGCDQNMWRYVTPAFEEQFKIVLFDHVGAGKSDWDCYDFDKYSSLQAYADDIIEICEELDFTQVIFVGHSVSSMIGLLVGIKEPTLLSMLIMVSPSPCYINKEGYAGGFSRSDIDELLASMESNYLGWSSQITPVIMGNPDKPEMTEELNNSFCRTDPKIAAQFAKATFLADNRSDLAKLKVNALVLQCKEDLIAPLQVGHYVADNISEASIVILDATGHCPHLTAPTETVSAIKEFLAVLITN